MLQVGQSVFLRCDAGKGLTTVFAFRPDHYLMIDARGLDFRPEPGATIALRFFDNGSYINYTAVKTGHHPDVGLLVLTGLRQTDVTCRRRANRFFLNLPVSYQSNGDEQGRVGLVKDISAVGLRFLDEIAMAIDTPLVFRFSFGKGLGMARYEGTIVRRDELPDGYAYGVLFERKPTSGADPLDRFLDDLTAIPEYATPEPDVDTPTPVGQTLTMTIENRQLISRIRGFHINEWLLTDIPHVNGTMVTAVRAGEIEARVRFLREGVVTDFKTVLERQYTTPSPVWFWSYPERVERSLVRRSHRMRTALHVDIEWSDGSGSGLLVDMSPDGGRLAFGQEGPQKGEAVKIAFYLSDGHLVTGVVADVRGVRQEKDACYLGLSFRREPTPSFEKLDRFFDSLALRSTLERGV